MTGLIDIFTAKLMSKPAGQTKTADNVVRRGKNPCLKSKKNREVVTREDVLVKIKETEEKTKTKDF